MVQDLDRFIWTPTAELMEEQQLFIAKEISEIGVDRITKMVETAIEFRGHAYADINNLILNDIKVS